MHQLERLRMERKLTVLELAARAKISNSTVMRVERYGRDGKRLRVKIDTAAAIAQALGVDMSDIFRGHELTENGRQIRTGGKYTRACSQHTRVCADCGDIAASAVAACENCDSVNLVVKIA